MDDFEKYYHYALIEIATGNYKSEDKDSKLNLKYGFVTSSTRSNPTSSHQRLFPSRYRCCIVESGLLHVVALGVEKQRVEKQRIYF